MSQTMPQSLDLFESKYDGTTYFPRRSIAEFVFQLSLSYFPSFIVDNMGILSKI